MPIRIGSAIPSAIYLGSTAITRAYLGSTLVYESGPSLPTLTVTGGTITPFTQSGVDYVEVAFTASGSFTLSADIDWHNRALGAGGGTGGHGTDPNFYPGAGGAGGLIRVLGAALGAGEYSVTIGAGGAAITSGFTRNSGSNSVLSLPGGGTETAIGGGGGATSGSGMTAGVDGGSGGAARGGNVTSTGTAGAGTSGQGYAGGLGFGDASAANRASGGSGGAGGVGGNASSGVGGVAGAGVLLDWIATPRTVCAGDRGMTQADVGIASPGRTFGSGSMGSVNADTGKGGDGFLFLVVRADQVNVVAA